MTANTRSSDGVGVTADFSPVVSGEGKGGRGVLPTKAAKASSDDLGHAGGGGQGGAAGAGDPRSSLNATADDAAVAAVAAHDRERSAGTTRAMSGAGFRVPGRASLTAQVRPPPHTFVSSCRGIPHQMIRPPVASAI